MKPRVDRENIVLSWEKAVEQEIRDAYFAKQQTRESDQPLMVSISGIPGSGKSTSAEILAEDLGDIGCVLMPHDGYHIPKSDLMKQPNAMDLVYRRGAPDTFDPESLCQDLKRIKQGWGEKVTIPGFDHSRGDPDQDVHTFMRDEHNVLICEGLYLLHEGNGWEDIPSIFDLSIFVEADLDKCMDRVKVRNLVIPGYTPDEIRARVDAVDRVNAMTVIESSAHADIVVRSVA